MPKILKRYQDDIAALETYKAECEAVSKQIGLADAERRHEALSDQLSAIQAEARACRATTFEGVRAKLQATIDPGEIADFERTQKELPLDPAASAILSLWRDVHQVEG